MVPVLHTAYVVPFVVGAAVGGCAWTIAAPPLVAAAPQAPGGSRFGRKKGGGVPATPAPIKRPAKLAPAKPSKRG